MSTTDHDIELQQQFLTQWPFFGPWCLRLAELATTQNVQLESLSALREFYFQFLEPSEALSKLTGDSQS